MARFLKTLYRCGTYDDTQKKRMFFVGIFIIMVLACARILPDDKAPAAASEETAGTAAVKTHVVRRTAVDMQGSNPLQKEAYPRVDKVVAEYYRGLAKDASFVDSYDNVVVYTKEGPYENSFIVFAYYEMKIKDIYTKVPGLGTLYVEEGKDGKLSVIRHVTDENVTGLVKTLMEHTDVKALTGAVEEGYAQAAASDAMLRESLAGLKEAYESTAGTGRTAAGNSR